MAKKKRGNEMPKAVLDDDARALAVIEPGGDKGVQLRLVLMNRSKPPTPGQRHGDEESNIHWVFKSMTPARVPVPGTDKPEEPANIRWDMKQMAPRSGRGRSGRAPSIGSMQVPGKV